MNKIIHFPTLLIALTISVSAQVVPRITDRPIKPATESESQLFVVGEVKGTVPSRAVFLPKPDYPIEARSSGSEGSVRVEVDIDIEGNVSKTSVILGAKELHSVAMDAARRSKFRIERNAAGEPQAVSGVLAYEFVIRKATWATVGWGLSGLEMFPASTIPIPAVRKAFEVDWRSEHELLEKIDAVRKMTPEVGRPAIVRGSSSVNVASGSTRQSISRGIINLPPPPPSELKVAATELLTLLRGRLVDNKLAAWQFELGIGLRRAIDEYRNPYKTAQATATVKRLIESAPDSASESTLQNLRDLESLLSTGRSVKTLEAISVSINAILSER